MAGDDRKSGGMFDDEPKEVKKTYHGMFEEDRTAHKMTPKKQKTITVIVIVVALIVIVVWFLLSRKWRKDVYRRFMSAPRDPRQAVCLCEAPVADIPLL